MLNGTNGGKSLGQLVLVQLTNIEEVGVESTPAVVDVMLAVPMQPIHLFDGWHLIVHTPSTTAM